MRNVQHALVLFLALVVLTGCPAPPKDAQQTSPSPLFSKPSALDELIAKSRSTQPTPTPTPRSPQTPSSTRTLSASRAQPPAAAPRFPNKWIPWEDWSWSHGWGKPAQVSQSPFLTYELRSPNGSLKLTMGSRVAKWNQLMIALGFVPFLTNGMPHVHLLDVAKNFEPLVNGNPWTLHANPGRAIVIDPGHGGENTGARAAAYQAFEKDLALDWAFRTRDLLARRGWKVFLTRTNDIHLSLVDRVAFTESIRPDLFLSLHFNSVPETSDPSQHEGIETYCLTPAGMPSNLIRGFDDDPTIVFPNNEFDAANLQLAVRVHQALVETCQAKDRGIRRARFMTVLQGQRRPAILLEGGYLTHPEEGRRILSPTYRQRLAEAVASALN